MEIFMEVDQSTRFRIKFQLHKHLTILVHCIFGCLKTTNVKFSDNTNLDANFAFIDVQIRLK